MRRHRFRLLTCAGVLADLRFLTNAGKTGGLWFSTRVHAHVDQQLGAGNWDVQVLRPRLDLVAGVRRLGLTCLTEPRP